MIGKIIVTIFKPNWRVQKMTPTEIKKLLYKEKPLAQFSYAKKGYLIYQVSLKGEIIYFQIPFDDIGDAEFTPEMQSQLLIRYLL